MSNSQQPGVLDRPGARPSAEATAGGRPVGAMIIAVMFLFYVVVVGYNAFDAFVGMSAAGISAAARSDARWALILLLVQLPFYLATAIGLWRLKQWGRYLALIFLAINIARFVVTAFFAPVLGMGLLIALSNSIIPLAIMLYLLHPSIRPMFRSGW
jgi:uncharacterized membrane protein (DUF2068 family)